MSILTTGWSISCTTLFPNTEGFGFETVLSRAGEQVATIIRYSRSGPLWITWFDPQEDVRRRLLESEGKMDYLEDIVVELVKEVSAQDY